MAIEGFEYQAFSENLASQVGELLPKEFSEFEQNYVKNTVKNFAALSGEALYNDAEGEFTAEQAMLITQIIAEWSFHKSIDLIRSGILPDYWDTIMQKIAFTIFEVSKTAIKQNLPQDDILQVVEHQVIKTYNEAIEELKAHGILNEEQVENAEKQSNINAMMDQIQEEKDKVEQEQQAQAQAMAEQNQGANVSVPQPSESGSKLLKLASVALLLQCISKDKVTTILNKFNPDDAKTVIQYMQMPDLNQKVDKSIAMKCLNEMKTTLPESRLTNPTKILQRLRKLFATTERTKIELLIKSERANVKQFISSAYSGDFDGVPVKVGNVITQYLEEAV